MRCLADECCDAGTVSAVREAGYDVRSVAEDFAGESDDVVLRRARVEDRVLLTEDKDFGTLVTGFRSGSRDSVSCAFPNQRRS
jgi:predicted nuclease of predicted toxin-antitoxin system